MTTIAESAAKRQQYNMKYVWAISLSAALGGLMFGYDWIVIGGTKPFYEKFFDLRTASEEGWAMSSALVGCLAGAILAGGLSDKFGRKRLLILSALVFVVSSVATGLADHFFAFNLWRIAGGIAIGLASNLSPMYIAEVSPAAVRGRLVAMNQFTIVVGILLCEACNYGIVRYGLAADRAAVTEHARLHAGSLDSQRVAKELARQVPREKRDGFIAQFTALSKRVRNRLAILPSSRRRRKSRRRERSAK